ncbi:MAG: alpha/beta fold hydrolase [Acidobacteria bacterium]|nr:alpha/beta fold hydrolase [Acidobacteriota bacterium]
MLERVTPDLFALRVQGTRVVCYERGDGPVLLLIHGMFGDHLDWEPALEPLARDHRVLAPDMPGFGESEKPDRNYSAEFFVAALIELLDRLGIERVTLVGNSFGGIVSVRVALAHPGRVERLVLVSGLREFNEQERSTARQRLTCETLLALTPGMHRLMFAPIFAQAGPIQERYFEKQDAKLSRPDYPNYARALARSIETALTAYSTQQLDEIRCPTLLLWGDLDAVIPVKEACSALPRLMQGELVVLPGGGHALQLDLPQAFVRAVESFVRKTSQV